MVSKRNDSIYVPHTIRKTILSVRQRSSFLLCAKTNRSLFFRRKAASVSIFMMIAEILIVLIVSYSSIQIAQAYASSETVEKIIIADDIKMMIDTFAGIPGDAAAQYPANVSRYTFILSSGSITVFIKGEGEQKQIVRHFFLPQGYNAFGTVEGKEALCLKKEKQRFLLRECERVGGG